VTARRDCRRLALADDGIIGPIKVQIAARGGRTGKPRSRMQRATAARQALSLCEAELLRLTGNRADVPYSSRGQPRSRPVATRAALRAVGMPPHTAAAFRRRLRLIPEQEAGR
jgi:hypothetical protein